MRTQIVSIVIIITVLNCISCASNNDASSKTIQSVEYNIDYSKLSGKWMSDCANGNGSIIIMPSLDTAFIDVTSNQIQISSLVNASEDCIEFRLIKPNDLGEGGIRLHWADFSTDSVIAFMKPVSDSVAEITWFGFYDTKLKNHIWRDGFDILSINRKINKVKVKKCPDFHFED